MGVGNANAAIGAALWQTVLRQNIGKVVRISFTTLKVPSNTTPFLSTPAAAAAAAARAEQTCKPGDASAAPRTGDARHAQG